MVRLSFMWKCWSAVACCGLLLSQQASAESAAELAVDLPPAQAQQEILRVVAHIAPGSEQHRRYHMALPFGAALFPPTADLAAPISPPTLAAWLALPPLSRSHDVLIVPDTDYYWNAEGRRYSCQFMIHVEARPTGSQLQLLQVRPTEYAGKHFDLLGRTGPGRYITLRPTTPSPQSLSDLKSFLAEAFAKIR